MKINWVKDDPMRWRSGQYQKKIYRKTSVWNAANGKWKMENEKPKIEIERTKAKRNEAT